MTPLTAPAYGTPEFWARTRPDAPAVINGDAAMTYGEWNARADRVAEGLAALGLGPGDRLGLRFRLGFEWFVIQRALQKLGVAQVAVSWKLTPPEAVHILGDSGARGLACDDTDAGGWAAHDPGLLVTVGQAPGAPGVRYEDLLATPDPPPRYGPFLPSIVLYTSGTTGAPRGVPPLDAARIDVDRLVRYAAAIAGAPPYPEDAVCLLTLPVHHGLGPSAAAATLLRGGAVVLLDRYDPEDALGLIDRHRVQVWTAVPTMLLRIRSLPEDVRARYDLSSLTALTVSAAAVPPALKEWIRAHLGERLLWEIYGASEVGLVTCAAPADHRARPGTSGRPYDGVEVAVVDDRWDRLPAGVTGEIAVSTPVAINRYLGHDPLGDDTIRDGFHRTGDVGHLDEDGFLFVTDRVKDMIVAGGVNIYPAEIEKVLVEHPDVADAAVIGIPEPDFGEQPLAFVVPRPAARPTAAEMLAFLDGRLAPYKRPRQFVLVDELPRNPTGKVLKYELRAPFWAGRDRSI
jgi:long-chain acyl-CoA synthetase